MWAMAGLDVSVEGSRASGVEPALDPPTQLQPESRFLNRELSWLDFDARVLALAEDASVPLLERVKFLAIFSQNLDEFFQVRVVGAAGAARRRRPRRLARRDDAARAAARDPRPGASALIERAGRRLHRARSRPRSTRPASGSCDWDELSEDGPRATSTASSTSGSSRCSRRSRSIPAHPFPYISNLSLNLAVGRARPGDRRASASPASRCRRCCRASSRSPTASGSCRSSRSSRRTSTALFPGMEIVAHHPFRVTRDADLELATTRPRTSSRRSSSILRRRRSSARVVRLEVDATMTDEVLELLLPRARARRRRRLRRRRPARPRRAVGAVRPRPSRPEGRAVDAADAAAPRAAPTGHADLFARPPQGDVLVHHPYDSFATSVEAFIEQAARDPRRARDQADALPHRRRRQPASCASLIRAAEPGKQVVALVELKARFDEQANIECARSARRGGRPRRVRPGRPEDARQDPARRAPGGRRHPPLLPRRHRQLQPEDRARSTRTSACSPPTPSSAPTSPSCSTYLTGYSRQRRYRKLLVAPVDAAARARGADRSARPSGAGRPHRHEDEQPRRPRDDRRALRGVAGGRADRPASCAASAACGPACPGLSETHPRALDRRPLPRALAHLPLRHRRRAGRVPHRLGRPHAAQPRPAGRGARAGRPRPRCATASTRSSTSTWPTTRWRGSSTPTARGIVCRDRRCQHAAASSRSSPSSRARAVETSGVSAHESLSSPPGFHLPQLERTRGRRSSPTTPSRPSIELTYHDTADLRLARAGVTLLSPRRRRLGRDSSAARPPPGRSSGTTSTASTGAAGQPPPAAVDLVAGARAHGPGRARSRVCGHRTPSCRAPRRVRQAARRGRSTTRCRCSTSGRVAARFRELEVEVDDAAPEGLAEALVARLRAAGAGPPDSNPKIVRALGPAGVASRPTSPRCAVSGRRRRRAT